MSSSIAARSGRLETPTRTARRQMQTRSRAVAWAEIVALALITAALIAATVIGSSRMSTHTASLRVRVESGQTLWGLATQHPVNGCTTEQTAELIARLNDVDGGALTAGAVIRIPAQADNNLLVASR